MDVTQTAFVTQNVPRNGFVCTFGLMVIGLTTDQWVALREKRATLTLTEKEEIVEPQQAILPAPSSPQPVGAPPATIEEEENPFRLDDGETAITAAQDLHSTDKEKIKTLGNVANPKAFAFGHMFTAWERLEGAQAIADLDEIFLQDLEKFQIGRAGKENRAKLYAEVLKADMQREFELQQAGVADRALGRK